MTLNEFCDVRGRLVHRLLYNECLKRLNGGDNLIDASASLTERAMTLTQASLTHLSEAANFRRAAGMWIRGNAEFSSVATEVMKLRKMAAHLDNYEPGPQFPPSEVMIRWLQACDAEMQAVEEILLGGAAAEVRLRRFWDNALRIVDWMASFSQHNPLFWQNLKRPASSR